MKLLIIVLAGVVLCGAPPGRADTVTLKSGEIVEGDIIADTNGVVQIRVANAKRTIFSVRAFNRPDIQAIQHATAEELAFQEVQRRRLTPASFPVEHYDRTIRDAFQPFLTNYPDSIHTPAVAELLAQWTAERDKVAGGAVKWGNRWYEGDGVKFVANQIKAARLIDEGDRQLEYNRYEAALAKYREALASGPLADEVLDQISIKVNGVAQRWKTAVSAATPTGSPPAQLQTINTVLQQFTSALTQARAENQRLAAVEARRQADEVARLAAVEAQRQADEAARLAAAAAPPTPPVVEPPAAPPVEALESIVSVARKNWILLTVGVVVVIYFIYRRQQN